MPVFRRNPQTDAFEEQTPETKVDVGCCANPMPRIATKSGRLFCASCKTYLSAAPDPLRDAGYSRSTSDAQEG